MSNTYTEEEIERCTLTDRQEIIFYLRELIKHGDRVSLTFDEGRLGFLTILLDVGEEDGYLYFDIGGSTELNNAFLRARRYVFASVIDGIRIQFTTGQAVQTSYGGGKAFAVAIPETMLRLQRRQFFRISLPSTKPCICRLRRNSPRELALTLRNISMGGVGLVSNEKLDFETLEIIENCSVDLRENGVLFVTLDVRYVYSNEIRAGKHRWYMGCRFVDLSASYEALIQRMMVRIEAEQRALLAG